MVLKLADALSRPLHRHFSSSKHSETLTQATISRQHKTPNIHPWTLFATRFPALFYTGRNKPTLPKPQRKYLEARYFWTTSKYPPLDAFSPFHKNTPHEMQARPSSRQPRQEIYSQRKYFTTPDPFITFNKCFSSPLLFAMFSKQHFLYTQPGQAHQLTSHYV